MDAYRTALTSENTTLMIEPDSAFFDDLHSPDLPEGATPPAAPEAAASAPAAAPDVPVEEAAGTDTNG
jgi:hypothetical protein